MPLTTRNERQLLHTRTVTCQAWSRHDGLWDIEGHMTDIKTADVANQDRGGVIQAGEPIHEMWLRITIDLDMTIHDAEASTDYAPFNLCQNITSAYKKLIGLKIGPGWNKKVKTLLGQNKGCTHHTELLGPMATTAFQALYQQLKAREEKNDSPPGIMNTCHALASHSPVAKRLWPDHADKEDKTAQAS